MADGDFAMWTCAICTYANDSFVSVCEMCGSQKPEDPIADPAERTARKNWGTVREQLDTRYIYWENCLTAFNDAKAFAHTRDAQRFMVAAGPGVVEILLNHSRALTVPDFDKVYNTLAAFISYFAIAVVGAEAPRREGGAEPAASGSGSASGGAGAGSSAAGGSGSGDSGPAQLDEFGQTLSDILTVEHHLYRPYLDKKVRPRHCSRRCNTGLRCAHFFEAFSAAVLPLRFHVCCDSRSSRLELRTFSIC